MCADALREVISAMTMSDSPRLRELGYRAGRELGEIGSRLMIAEAEADAARARRRRKNMKRCVYVCDACGAEIECMTLVTKVRIEPLVPSAAAENGLPETVPRLDLCPDCARAVAGLIDALGKGEEPEPVPEPEPEPEPTEPPEGEAC